MIEKEVGVGLEKDILITIGDATKVLVVVGLDQVQEQVQIGIELDAVSAENMIIS